MGKQIYLSDEEMELIIDHTLGCLWGEHGRDAERVAKKLHDKLDAAKYGKGQGTKIKRAP